jgi:ABC-type uncharacterized transport system substrate-binding protein
MTRRSPISTYVALVALACASLTACATSETIERQNRTSRQASEDPPQRPGRKTLLIAMPDSPDFLDARRGLVTEIRRDFNVSTFVVTPTSTVEDLAAAIERTSPVCLVLMNNTTLALFQKYQARPRGQPLLPAVVLMTSFLEETSSRIKRITGIAYEVPAVTGFIHLRMVVTARMERIGVVYRPVFGRFVERQKALAAREGIEIVPMAVPSDANADQLRSALRALCERRKVDALWLLNDNALIHDGGFLEATWRPILQETNLPLLVGVPNLVDPGKPFGTISVVPDHEALGLQAANLIFDLADNDWNVDGHAIELPLSVKTVVDLKQVRERFGLRVDALQHVDRALDESP